MPAMVETVGSDDSTTMSHHHDGDLPEPIRETIDIQQMELPPLPVDILAASVTQENDELFQNSQPNESQESVAPVVRKSR